MTDPKPPTSALDALPALRVGARLSEQLVDALVASIREGQLQPGQRLPTEAALVQRFGVSRTVVREVLSRLKTMGLLESRQGSGAFIREASAPELAAARHTPQALKLIKTSLQAMARAVAAGGDGVAEDVAFHAAIARATGNPFLLATLAYLNRFLLDATRANEALRDDLAEQVRNEHAAVVAARR